MSTTQPRTPAGSPAGGQYAGVDRPESDVDLGAGSSVQAGRSSGSVVLYEREDGSQDLSVRLEDDDLWLTQQQIAELFGTSRENITMHLRSVYEEGELDEEATRKDLLQVRSEGSRTVRRQVAHYNLDAILSVGYRVRSGTATRFRQWATARLRDYLVRGYVANERRLAELGAAVSILQRTDDDSARGVAEVLARYLPALSTLRDYDDGEVTSQQRTEPTWTMTADDARAVVCELREQFPQDRLLGQEREGGGLDGVVSSIYATWDGEDLHPSTEEKAAHLLYSAIKNHPLADGNKRTAAAMFVTFLERNDMLNHTSGDPRISPGALATLTLMVAASQPEEHEQMIGLTMRMLEQTPASTAG